MVRFLKLTIIVYLVAATWYAGVTLVGPWFEQVTGIDEIGQIVILPLLIATGLQGVMWNHLPAKVPQLLLLWVMPTLWSIMTTMLDSQSIYTLWEQLGLIHITAGSIVLVYTLVILMVRDVRDALHNHTSPDLIVWLPVYGIISLLVLSMSIIALSAWAIEHSLITFLGLGMALIHQLVGYVRVVNRKLSIIPW